jgi:serine/threonine protein phosphatase 1
MRTIVVGDIHGCYNELVELITDLEDNGKYNKNTDRLIFLGDYIDRGEDSRKVIRFIRELQKDNDNVIALMGNHEKMCIDYFSNRDYMWEINGYYATLESYKGYGELADDVNWMEQLPLYYEDEYFVYAHAGVDVDKPLDKQTQYNLLWIRESFLFSTKPYNKRVVFGHTPSLSINDGDKPYYTYTNNIGIDTGCVFGGYLTALIIEDDKVKGFYQIPKELNEELEEETNDGNNN